MSEHSNHDFLELTRQIEQTLEFDENNYTILSSSRSETSKSDLLRPYCQLSDFEWNNPPNENNNLPPGLNLERNENHFQQNFFDDSPYQHRFQQQEKGEIIKDNPGITEIKLDNITHEIKASRFQKHFQVPVDHSKLKLTSDLYVPVGILANTIPVNTEENQEKTIEKEIENKIEDNVRIDLANDEGNQKKEENIEQVNEETPKGKESQQPIVYKILSKKEIEARRKLKEEERQKEIEALKSIQKQAPKISESTPKNIEIKEEIQLNEKEGKDFTNTKHERKYSGTKKGKRYTRTEIDSPSNNDQNKKTYQKQDSKRILPEKDNTREQRKSILFHEENKELPQKKSIHFQIWKKLNYLDKQGKFEIEESIHKNNPYGHLLTNGDFESSSSESKDSNHEIEDKVSENIRASKKELKPEKDAQNESIQKTKKKKKKWPNSKIEEIDKEGDIEKHEKEIEEIKEEVQEEQQLEKEESSEEEKSVKAPEQENSKAARNKKKRAAKKRNKKINTLEELEEKGLDDKEEQENKKIVPEKKQIEIQEFVPVFPDADFYNDLIINAKVSKISKINKKKGR